MPPSFHHERELTSLGHFVIGVDEAGCGCLAGPVIASAVHLPINSRIGMLNDSKLLSQEKREEILERFLELGMQWTIGMADASEVDCFNVRQATLLAMKRAVLAFKNAEPAGASPPIGWPPGCVGPQDPVGEAGPPAAVHRWTPRRDRIAR